ncbi:hypothetical protein E7T09_13025 [Deinococcus sp. KSM4-11]|uniref:hypothetical protein n=1 Tax=Deinococcus sp. KSM4-11 TaxID=2568654 RepID=UPI0010A5927D|nr:hypothetical protein [Deinococcus sp. KSM4-11]THF86147.1 hypothetical protein E7T09_13025 [Deinococcus sp. KSM4-11]
MPVLTAFNVTPALNLTLTIKHEGRTIRRRISLKGKHAGMTSIHFYSGVLRFQRDQRVTYDEVSDMETVWAVGGLCLTASRELAEQAVRVLWGTNYALTNWACERQGI